MFDHTLHRKDIGIIPIGLRKWKFSSQRKYPMYCNPENQTNDLGKFLRITVPKEILQTKRPLKCFRFERCVRCSNMKYPVVIMNCWASLENCKRLLTDNTPNFSLNSQEKKLIRDRLQFVSENLTYALSCPTRCVFLPYILWMLLAILLSQPSPKIHHKNTKALFGTWGSFHFLQHYWVTWALFIYMANLQ
jgi:hypothetical protein